MRRGWCKTGRTLVVAASQALARGSVAEGHGAHSLIEVRTHGLAQSETWVGIAQDAVARNHERKHIWVIKHAITEHCTEVQAAASAIQLGIVRVWYCHVPLRGCWDGPWNITEGNRARELGAASIGIGHP